MSSVSTPPTTFYSQVAFKDRVTMTQPPGGARSALKLVGDNSLSQIFEIFDYLFNPIQSTNTAGGDAVLGDRRSVFGPGDVFNAIFQIMGASDDNLSSTAGGFRAGHTTGQGEVYFGVGAPSASHPRTSGIPANGTLYGRFDGGTGTTIYQVRTGAWAGIL
jgi:hypothetical protein